MVSAHEVCPTQGGAVALRARGVREGAAGERSVGDVGAFGHVWRAIASGLIGTKPAAIRNAAVDAAGRASRFAHLSVRQAAAALACSPVTVQKLRKELAAIA